MQLAGSHLTDRISVSLILNLCVTQPFRFLTLKLFSVFAQSGQDYTERMKLLSFYPPCHIPWTSSVLTMQKLGERA